MTLNEFHACIIGSNDATALVYHGRAYSYTWLAKQIEALRQELRKTTPDGSVVQLIAQFSPNAVAMLIALALEDMIVAPLTNPTPSKQIEYAAIIQAEVIIWIDKNDKFKIEKTACCCANNLIHIVRQRQHPGLIVMSSGSSGKSKAVVHDLAVMLGKLSSTGKAHKTIAFLLFDHVGGLNTLLQTLANRGAVIIPYDRTPRAICNAIAKHHVNALVTSPSFLNLLVLSQLEQDYDLSSLKIINYGSEPMPDCLLTKLVRLFPSVRFSQAYGMSELGVLAVRSKSSDSLFIRIVDTAVNMRIVGGALELKTSTSMLGYINAASPFTADGWLKTGDRVEVEGEYVKILGRESDIINVGGEKVYPAEVENVLMEIDAIEDVVVAGEPNAILGNIVKAKVKFNDDTDFVALKRSIRAHCLNKLPAYMVPQKIECLANFSHNARFKKNRKIA